MAESESAVNLLPQHLADLKRSTLTDETIRACGFYSVTDGAEAARLLRWDGACSRIVPALAIPFRGPDGARLEDYIRLRPDTPRTDKAGRIIKYESPRKVPNRAYFPPGTLAALQDAGRPLLATEGEKKAAAADQAGLPCLGLSGVYSWQKKRKQKKSGKPEGPRELIPDLAGLAWQGRRVVIVFDSDATSNDNVRWAEWHLAAVLQSQGAQVSVVRLPPGPEGEDAKPAKVGLDDFLREQGPDAFKQLLDAAGPVERPEDRRPKVLLGIEEHLSIGAAVAALAEHDQGLFQRGGQLVRVCRPSRPAATAQIKLSASPRPDPVPNADLRTRMTRHARFVVRVEVKGKVQEQRARPARWLVEGVGALGEWAGVRHLEAVVDTPVLRPDGSILTTPGYDPTTGILFEPSAEFPAFPEAPTREDAQRARDELLEAIADFPCEKPVHRAAWVSLTLTPLARFAFEGAAPLHLIDANVRAAGKGMMADVSGEIAFGRGYARATYSRDDEEMQKIVTAFALAGERGVLFDNISGEFGGRTLDAALTATEWQGRILGKSLSPRLPLLATWVATGNNVLIRADTARRICHIRLHSNEERPEERKDFKHPDLLAWVRRERGRLLRAALTILSAYCRAGKPDQGLAPWGSFEGWGALVRGAIVWCGLEDPGKARMTLVEGGDQDAAALVGLLAGWRELDPDGDGLTVAQALCLLDAKLDDRTPVHPCPIMRAVLADLFDLAPGKTPTSRRLGYKLRAFAGRNHEGSCFVSRPGGGGVARWSVVSTHKAAHEPSGGGGDGGDGGDVSAQPHTSSEANGSCKACVGTEGKHTPYTHHPHPLNDEAPHEEEIVL